MRKDVRVVYMGTPYIAVEPLKAIIEAGFNVVGVVTVPDKPAGRGQKLHQSPVKLFALDNNLHLLQPEKLKDPVFVEELNSLKPDIAVVVAFRMLPEIVWTIPKLGTFNLHASLLPQYRGAAPINWAIINGETKSGVTTFLIDKEIDTGNIIFQKEVSIESNETAGDLHDKLMLAGSMLVVETIDTLSEKNFKPIPQKSFIQEDQTLKPAPKIFRETCKIDWTKPINEIHNLIRGLSPYPGAWSEMEFTDDSITQVKVLKSAISENTNNTEIGSIITDGKTSFEVTCGNGSISIIELQVAGKRPMKTSEMLNGLRNILPKRMI
ncbi:MAG: methionyl-tRNA formyltransferase [Tenuifilaceae bacterium]